MSNATITGWFNFPKSKLNENQITQLRINLTYTAPYPDEYGHYKTIYLYREDEEFLSLPIEWTKVQFPTLFELGFDQRVTPGQINYTRLPDPYHPKVKDPEGQAKFMRELETALREHDNVLAVAGTGTGKTVCALKAAAVLGHRTLVLVHSESLRDQWIKEAKDKLGLTDGDIGIIQQNRCDIDRPISIGLLQTNARRDFPEDVYKAFGLVIVDECHKLSTEFFAEVLPKFHAKKRLGLSATIKRKDGSDVVLYSHLGSPRVISEAELMPIKVYVDRYYSERKLWGKDDRQRMVCLSKDPERNARLVKWIKSFYDANRKILVVSEKIDHLEELRRMCRDAGIPWNDMGQLTAKCNTYDRTYEWKKTGRRDVTPEEQELAKTKSVCFSTVQFVKEGIDVPSWDSYIEALPMWQNTQLFGRVRRYQKGKLFPKAIKIKDMKCSYSLDRFECSIKEASESGAEIINL
jgi:superfamily II DNA or RNA helicase